MKISGFGRQMQGGSYYRMQLPLGELAKHGYETSYAFGKVGVEPDSDTDLIVGHMIGHTRWWRGLRRHAPLVYELDDDPFTVEVINPVYPIYSDPLAQDNLQFCIQAADLVTVSVDPLAERISKLNKNVVVLRNCIDESLLNLERKRNERLTIGWAGGASHAFDILECARGVQRTLDRNPEVDLHLIGADFRFLIDISYERKHVRKKYDIKFTDWSAMVSDYYRTIDFDIGLAPLKSTKFAECKSAIKSLEYASLGIPVIASDTRPYRDFVIHGETGFLVRKEHEWAARLRELINDESMREEMGRAAKQLAARHTVQHNWQGWAHAYEGVINRTLPYPTGPGPNVPNRNCHTEPDHAMSRQV